MPQITPQQGCIINPPETAHFHFLCDIDKASGIAYDLSAGATHDFDLRQFDVVDFQGRGRISEPYKFEINLVSKDPDIDFLSMINEPAALYLKRGDHWDFEGGWDPSTGKSDRVLFGIVTDVQMGRRVVRRSGDLFYYRVFLAPRLWKLTLNFQSRVFQHRSVLDIIDDVLAGYDGDFLANVDYRIDVQDANVYYEREYTLQYQETDLSFISRLMEQEGLYYFFEHDPLSNKEILVIVDEKTKELDVEDSGGGRMTLDFSTSSDLHDLSAAAEENVTSFTYRQQMTTGRVRLRDYNIADFEDNLPAEEDVDTEMPGTYYEYGKFYTRQRPYVKTGEKDEGDIISADTDQQDFVQERTTQLDRLLKVRRQEIECRREVMSGISTCMGFSFGLRYVLTSHFRNGLNRDYLIIAVKHFGSQITLLGLNNLADLPADPADGSTAMIKAGQVFQATYYNCFQCIPTSVQFRAERRTPVPRMAGILTAKVERAESASDDQADVDVEGRYRVRLPFDESGTGAGQASRPFRLTQPYSGGNYGIHFPNHADTEMVFACVDGDVDNPIALGTVPNWKHHTPSPHKNHILKSQNPPIAAAHAPSMGGASLGDVFTFEAKKNVIRTHRGHMMVMDDADGTANVGITIQTGKGENATGRNTYWSSRMEMGGYRRKSILEQVIDSSTHVLTWLGAGFTRDFPSLIGEATSAIASQVVTGDYIADTYGDTTPIGVKLFTTRTVDLVGKDGVNIVSPNLLGMFGGDLIEVPPGGIDPRNWMISIVNFLMNTLYQGVIQKWAKEVKDSKKNTETYKSKGVRHPKILSFVNYEHDKQKDLFRNYLTSIVQLPGINLKSVGDIKLSAFQSVNVAAGQAGYKLTSFGSINQGADLNIGLKAYQGITIKAGGKEYEGEGLNKLLNKAGHAIRNPLFAFFQKAANKMGADALGDLAFGVTKYFPLTLENENSEILILTGAKTKGDILINAQVPKGKEHSGNVVVHAEGGDVRTRARWDMSFGTGEFEDDHNEDDVGQVLKEIKTQISTKEKNLEVFAEKTAGLLSELDARDKDTLENPKQEAQRKYSLIELRNDTLNLQATQAVKIGMRRGGEVRPKNMGLESDDTLYIGRTAAAEDPKPDGHDLFTSGDLPKLVGNKGGDVTKPEKLYMRSNDEMQLLTMGDDSGILVGRDASDKGKTTYLHMASGKEVNLLTMDDGTISIGKSSSKGKTKDVHIEADKKIDIIAGDQITLTCGQASITLKKDGTIEIKGQGITLDAGNKPLDAKAMGVKIDAKAKACELKGMATVLKATKDIVLDAKMNSKIKAGMNVELKGGLQAKISGVMVDVSGQAMGTFKGAITKVG